MEKRSSATIIALAGVLCTAGALSAQAPLEEPEWAPVVKRLTGEDLPAAMRLSTFVSHMDKMAASDPEVAKRFLGGWGIEPSDTDLKVLNDLYGDFDEDQGRRHTKMLHEMGDRPEVIREGTEIFELERASFTGGVLGAWLAHLKNQGYHTEQFLAKVLDSYSPTAFWGGRPPTVEELERKAAQFEKSFSREYGEPLEAVIHGAQQGGSQ